MGVELKQRMREEYGASPTSLDYSFFTSGSGGAGATVLAATFLILGEDALTFSEGRPRPLPTCTDPKKVLFPGVGYREVQRLNLLEAWSANKMLGIPNTTTFFGTAPFFWNALLAAMARLLPQDLLRDRSFGKALAAISVPIVYAVDSIFGTANAIRVDATGLSTDGSKIQLAATLAHPDLEACVGEAVHAFAAAAAMDNTPAGVFLPEEAFAASQPTRLQILDSCAIDSIEGLAFFPVGSTKTGVKV